MVRKNKKYLTKSINFGGKGNRARSIIERIEKRAGKTEVSRIVRNALIGYFSKSKEFKEIKISALLEERKEIKKRLREVGEELTKNADELEKLGIDKDKL